MQVHDHLRPPFLERGRAVPRLGLGVGEPVAVGVEVVVAGPELERLEAREAVVPVLAARVRLGPDPLVVLLREGVAPVRVDHRVEEDDGVVERGARFGRIARGEVLQQLEHAFAAGQLETVDRAAEPQDDGLVGDQVGGLVGRGAARIVEPLRGRLDGVQAGMVLGRGDDGEHQVAALPALALPDDLDAVRGVGEGFEVAHHLVVLGDALTERVPRYLFERRHLGGGGEHEHGEENEQKALHTDGWLDGLRNVDDDGRRQLRSGVSRSSSMSASAAVVATRRICARSTSSPTS